MKHLLLSLMLTLSVFARSVMTDYYQELYANNSSKYPILSYKLFVKNKPWYAKEVQFEDAKILVPYIREDFMQFVQEAGDGQETLNIKLWKMTDNNPLLGITKTLYEGNFPVSSYIMFFMREGKDWYKIEPLKRYTLHDFVPKGVDTRAVSILHNIGASVFYDLNIHKNDIYISLAINNKEIQKVCAGDNSIEVSHKDDYLYYCKHLQKKILHGVHYHFDKTKDYFSKQTTEVSKEKVAIKHTTHALSQKELFENILKQRTLLQERFHHE